MPPGFNQAPPIDARNACRYLKSDENFQGRFEDDPMIQISPKTIAFAALASVPCLIAPVAASAADQVAAPVYEPVAPVETGLGFGIVVGALGFVSPVYEGSDKYRVSGFPVIYPKFYGDGPGLGDRLTLRGVDDVRFALFQHQGFEVGPVAGYTFGREQDDATRIRGLGDVDGGLVVGGYAGYTFEPFFIDAAYVTQVTGDTDTGYQIKIAAGVEHRLTDRIDLTATLSTAFASDDYMDAYFSITPLQSANSAAGLAVYDADAGFKNAGIDLAMDYRFTERATFTASAGYSRLI
jgi:MipA family protein